MTCTHLFKGIPVASSLTHRFVDVNGVRLHIAEQGEGPLVLLLHR